MNTIAIDCRFASCQSGIGRYTRELVSRLVTNDSVSWKLLIKSENENWIKNIPKKIELIKADIGHYSLEEQTCMPVILKKSGADLLFAPHFNVPLFCPIPYVITIHDLILHRYPNQASFVKRAAYKILISKAARKAKHIITVSNFVMNDILRTFQRHNLSGKISVIREGVPEMFYERSYDEKRKVMNKFGISAPFYLYVGNSKEHKNVQMLIDAHASLPDNFPTLLLISNGREVNNLKISKKVLVLSGVSDDDLPAIYSSALAFVTASLYEGCGLPVLEAQACNCPVIASNNMGEIPEIAGDEAVLVPPTIKSLFEALKSPPQKPKHFNAPIWNEAAINTFNVLTKSLHSY